MLSLLVLLPLLTTILADNNALSTQPQLDPTIPIYLGDVFWPPSMTFIAWLPSEAEKPLEVRVKGLTNYKMHQPKYSTALDWCYRATDASNHALFSLAGVDALQIHDYFSEQAYITREGKRYANCFVTPESGRIGACEGVLDFDCEGGQKFTGPGTRGWSCWVIPDQASNGTVVGGKVEQEERLTDEGWKPTAVATGAMNSGSVVGAFTAGVTGSR